MIDRSDALTILKRHLDEKNPSQGVTQEKYLNNINPGDKDAFLNILTELESENAIHIKRGIVFVGPKYEPVMKTENDHSNQNILYNCNFGDQAQVGYSNDMSLSSSDADVLVKLIESLAEQDDPTLAESIMNVGKGAKDAYGKIKEWINIF